ncbi:uncharacterized protein [Pleurodeles waltl]|uniref:uncharacterized protein n=1 Tax=Pleurodeles waltl TaxID=8319 RepID=UPI0037099CFF
MGGIMGAPHLIEGLYFHCIVWLSTGVYMSGGTSDVMDLKLHLLSFACFLKLVPSDGLCVTQYSTISARPGDTVIMPCKFTVLQNLLNIASVVWQKTDLEDIAVVDLDSNPGAGEEIQDNKYKNRTLIHQDWPLTGHPNLTLYNLSTADLGNYTCYINANSWAHRCAEVQIALTFQQTSTSDTVDNVRKGDHEIHRYGMSEEVFIIVITSLYVCIAICICILSITSYP